MCFEYQEGSDCGHTPGEIEITCICTSGCGEEQDGGGTGGSDTGDPPTGRGGGGENGDDEEEDKCNCVSQKVCDLITEYEDVGVNFTPKLF